ncbi:hypothetical protein M527_15510 [Sphingobium indicum IP26]|uniref:Uncharacterized protein n=1 Tax=Sphingobium indicum F2 TaxID=1450518 RepID=A0A8E0WQ95_9SPHN|nr:hypothetical protein [Sphingobium indicum]EPR17739.1 hypothetical protein M527_15510 [Sphingobium indicum IP26]KER35250.1 hypothetical protein AL00_16830 [Sphingobium indicum F2]
MTAPDPTYNLSAFADRLFAEKQLLPLANQIRRARDLHSLSTDLVMAMESIDALEAELTVAADPDDHRKLITESALLNNALVLYVRATKTESKERGGFDLRARFGDEEKVVHKELSDLRDSAIAHFGSGGSYGGEWQAELVILQFSGAEAKVGVVTRRQTVDRNLVRRARQQIETALNLMRAVYYEKLAEITASIEAEAAADAEFSEEIHRHPLNLDLFMKSADAADAARGSFGSGYAMGSVSHR